MLIAGIWRTQPPAAVDAVAAGYQRGERRLCALRSVPKRDGIYSSINSDGDVD